MINLIDTYHQASWDLHYSLVRSGYNNPTIAINDDGFLPEDVTSPYLYYTGFATAEGHPLYFNQVPVPELWEIRGDNSQGEIYCYDQKRGHIHYTEPRHDRLVKAVDWYDARERLRLTDRYNKFGYRYGQTVYNLDGHAVLTSYFDREGAEVIVENHQTGDILLNEAGQVHLFKTRTAFVAHYLRVAGYNLDRIFYNSLAVPFFVTLELGQEGRDVLFWQEPIGDEVPGNMLFLLEGKGRDTQVMVQDQATYDKLVGLLPEEYHRQVAFLGCLYPFKDHAVDRKQALIMTNSDQLEHIDYLVSNNPDIHFHIGALTEMSSHLTRLSSHAHVSLYPNVVMSRVRELFQTCGIYLDINHHSEILSSVRVAFENQMVILGFTNTAHNRNYIADSLLFESSAILEANLALQDISNNPEVANDYLTQQQTKANLTTTNRYQELIG